MIGHSFLSSIFVQVHRDSISEKESKKNISRHILDRIGNAFSSHCGALRNRAITWVKVAAEWLKSVLMWLLEINREAHHAADPTASKENFPLEPPSLFPLLNEPSLALELESGRNLLLNYLDGLTSLSDQAPRQLGSAIRYCVVLSESTKTLSTKQVASIRRFFWGVKERCSIDLSLHLANRLRLQRILSERLDQLLQINNPSLDVQLELNLAKAELATSFGYGIIPTAEGRNGAVFIKTFENQPVGVFKAPKQLGVFDIIERAKRFLGQARLLNQESLAQEYAEVVAADLCKACHLDGMAPDAVMARFAGEEGAFISFLGGYQELSKVKEEFNERQSYTHEEQLKWQKMAVWNFLIGNLDPHDGNIFVKIDNGMLLDIRMIDHGNSFPEFNPGWLGARGNLGSWGQFKISSFPFHKDIKQWISKHIKEDLFFHFFDENEERGRFFKEGMRGLQLQRVRLLRECVVTGVIANPSLLAVVQTDEDYRNYLRKEKHEPNNFSNGKLIKRPCLPDAASNEEEQWETLHRDLPSIT